MVPRPVIDSPPTPLIPQYFAGREVFITGGTGFMGKVLVERLLWTCRDISRIHLLLRRKKDVAPEKRLVQLKQSQVFDVIREHCPEQLEKLSIIPGDITEAQLGMDDASLSQLSYVSVVFHVAATLKFDEPMKVAVHQNLRSVLTLMKICDDLSNVQVFIHVSTAYSNADLQTVEEKVYDAPAQLQQLLALVDALPDDMLKEITPKLISPKPNTYTFTKAMAESAVLEHARTAHYATSIYRPSIVVSAVQHPFPGWIENLNGPSGVLVSAGKGMLHVLSGDGDRRADMIPVDIAIDTLIAVAWETGVDDLREARVYHCSSYKNPITWRDFKRHMMTGVRAHPFDGALWYPWGYITANKLVHRFMEATVQTIPMNILAYINQLCGVKNRINLSIVCNRLHAMNEALQFFSSREWRFSTNNSERLRDRLTQPDRAVYNLAMDSIDWEDHITDFVKGARRYLLREKDEDIERAKKHTKMLHVIHNIALFLLALGSARLAYTLPAILRRVALLLHNTTRFKTEMQRQ